jgi:5-methylcytosine-specific restriction endonuclease McrA
MKQLVGVEYFEGKPCRICDRTLRYAKHKQCVACARRRGDPYGKKKEYYRKNREEIVEKKKQYYQKNREVINEKQKLYQIENHEKRSQWYLENRGQTLERVRAWNKENPDRRKVYRQKRRAAKKSVGCIPYTAKQLRDRLALFGNQCVYCFSKENITIDHFMPLCKGGIDAIANLVPACVACNCSKSGKDPIVWLTQQGYPKRYIDELVKVLLELAGDK